MEIDKNTVGMASFIASESVFFILLILAYVDLHGQVAAGAPTARSALDVPVTSFFTACLLSSSFTLHQAERCLRNECGEVQGTDLPTTRRMVSLWLGLTVFLGAAFLVGQAIEYRRLLTNGVTVGRDLFATSFFTLTGFHGLHVFIGLVMLATLTGLHLAGAFRRLSPSVLEAVGLYWHFVDAVWVVIFSIVYLRVLG